MTLVRVEALPAAAGLEQALRDGVARGYDGALPEPREGAQCYLVRAGGESVGVLGIERERPARGAATLLGVAIDPAWRGHAFGTRALRAAERRLRREGVGALFSRVPRTNGRGLYFWLRAGYAPIAAPTAAPSGDDEATWLRRAAWTRRR